MLQDVIFLIIKRHKMAVNDCFKYFEVCDSLPLDINEFYNKMSSIFPQYSDVSASCFLEIMIGYNAPFIRICDEQDYVDMVTKNILLQDSTFCFVDIETTGTRDVQNGQIIEIGAIKVKGNEIIGQFESFAYSSYVPQEIIDLTGINDAMLKNAPKIEDVLESFIAFLGDSVFVAHNVGFDYGFINDSLLYYGQNPLLNTRLCTIELSRKAILSKKYALSYLNQMLGINIPISHRALADAITSYEIFKICNLCLPSSVKTAQDIIDFSKGKLSYPTRAISKNALTKRSTKYEINNKSL